MTVVDRLKSLKSDEKTKAEGMSILGKFGLVGLAVGQDQNNFCSLQRS